MAQEPVNLMGRSLLRPLRAALDRVHSTKGVRCVVFCSGLKQNLFSAGFDVNELRVGRSATTESFKECVETWGASSDVAAALTCPGTWQGKCFAGGCFMSLCCDFRIATQDAVLGLNEVQIGLPGTPYPRGARSAKAFRCAG
eukprot:scaffold495_cov405-Prasinococcus_capsulatus_cf.AAC.7